MPFEFWQERLRQPPHPLAASPYCCSRWFFFMDLMHLMDCKGVTGIVAGSVLGMLMRRRELGNTKAERLQIINQHRATWYGHHPRTHRMPQLLANSVARDGWGELSGPAIKAAVTRACAPWIRDLCLQYCASDNEEDRAVRQLTNDLVEFYHILYSEGRFVSDEGLARLGLVTERFGCNFMRLREYADRQGLLLWHVTPKVHKMQHVPLLASVLNPKFVQNYAEESLIGTCTKIWARSVKSRYRHVVQRNVLAKKLVALMLYFELPH
eukprot:5098270-Lingulodinium_polyedra.AAC.1